MDAAESGWSEEMIVGEEARERLLYFERNELVK